jgi:hypothetical protein
MTERATVDTLQIVASYIYPFHSMRLFGETLKNRVYVKNPQTLQEFKDEIRRESAMFPETVLEDARPPWTLDVGIFKLIHEMR